MFTHIALLNLDLWWNKAHCQSGHLTNPSASVTWANHTVQKMKACSVSAHYYHTACRIRTSTRLHGWNIDSVSHQKRVEAEEKKKHTSNRVHAISSISSLCVHRWKWNMKIRTSCDWRAVHAVLFLQAEAIGLLLFLRSVTGVAYDYIKICCMRPVYTEIEEQKQQQQVRANECSEIFT